MLSPLRMSKQSDALKERAKAFGIDVLRLIDKLAKTPGAQVVASQLARSATSVGANYIAACNARSRREFIAKLGVVNEEWFLGSKKPSNSGRSLAARSAPHD